MNDTLEIVTNSSIPLIDPYLPVRIAINWIYLILVFPLNSYVVWLILSGAGGTIASEFFHLNLTASLIIFSLTAVFFFAWRFTGIAIFAETCTLAFFIFFLSVPWLHCCICVERYIAVVHPVVFLRYKALWYRVACCCVVWLMVLAFSSMYFWSPIVLVLIFVAFDVVCISVASYCCLSVLRALKQPGPGEGQRDSGKGNNMKIRAFKIILISLIVMVLTTIGYVPYVLTTLLDYASPVCTYTTYTIAMIATFVHPLLYIHKAVKLAPHSNYVPTRAFWLRVRDRVSNGESRTTTTTE